MTLALWDWCYMLSMNVLAGSYVTVMNLSVRFVYFWLIWPVQSVSLGFFWLTTLISTSGEFSLKASRDFSHITMFISDCASLLRKQLLFWLIHSSETNRSATVNTPFFVIYFLSEHLDHRQQLDVTSCFCTENIPTSKFTFLKYWVLINLVMLINYNANE